MALLTSWNTPSSAGGWTLPGTTPIQGKYSPASVTCPERERLVNQSRDLDSRIQRWQEILNTLTSASDWIVRQLIQMEINNLKRQKSNVNTSLRLTQIESELNQIEEERLREVAAFGEPGMAYTEGGWQLPGGEFAATGPWVPVGGKGAEQVYAERLSREAALQAEAEALRSGDYSQGITNVGGIQIPDWMQEYLDPRRRANAGLTSGAVARKAGATMGYGEGEAYLTNQPALRPLGAQADLDQERQQMLAAYLGWVKAGSPMNAEDYLSSVGNTADWWEEYTQRSMKQHPAAVYLGKATRRIR